MQLYCRKAPVFPLLFLDDAGRECDVDNVFFNFYFPLVEPKKLCKLPVVTLHTRAVYIRRNFSLKFSKDLGLSAEIALISN